MRNTLILFFILVIFSLTQTSCEDFGLDTQREEIRERLIALGQIDQAIETDEGVFIVFENEGVGTETPDLESTVDVIYEGRLFETDEVFDSSNGSISQFTSLGNTIAGWRIAIPNFKRGAKGTIYIPAVHAYGTTQSTPTNSGITIERGSILIFDVTLYDFFN